MATLIIALSILEGFQETIRKKIIDFDSHIQVTSYQSILPNYKRIQPNIEKILSPYFLDVNPYAANLAIISNRFSQEGIIVKGILPNNQSLKLDQNIILGKYDFSLGEAPSIIVGKKLADKIFVNVGDEVTIFALNNNKIPSPDNLPNIQKFIVTGIFESGMAEYDDLNAYTSIKTAQQSI